MVKINWLRRASKQLVMIDPRYRKAISEKVSKLTTFPTTELDIKKLRTTDNQYRIRVGNYRIIFEVTDGEPVICTIQQIKRRASKTY
ncbi:type II toxin-antitoxin system RelE/ParE family toxin [Candidatus Fukatsuia symbiotica]|uniref:Type II toxin-antitoxin system RelE/ParE family toxin n=1 Tax=Candidatus Fukatsuia symbiotica TaxID=1878942 RepID=A0A2U8I360_9GAMM|nr:type II toxin-antitoxin system RelE/ParE family toxin [Candidatus Fukatsuia symbiotica]AWK13541.1 hypothetical protein CCS41_01935 [Candidatus Fukatsuia symbiotica]MEA9445332.1 type II toxin-antitoxin system RelE/ParE family toxin [Candidatus Fukatsuia symbiotica]